MLSNKEEKQEKNNFQFLSNLYLGNKRITIKSILLKEGAFLLVLIVP